MEIFTMPVGDYRTNCYLVCDDKKNCVIIDPGDDAWNIVNKAKQEELNIRAILLTHGHFDHVGAVKRIAEDTRCAVWLHEKELLLPSYLSGGSLRHTNFYAGDGSVVSVGKLAFEVLETPGHTMGSVCLRCEDVIFSGDTLFAGSCGRTDLGGSMSMLLMSLKRLAALPGDATVYPGHGEASTLDAERRNNPYMR